MLHKFRSFAIVIAFLLIACMLSGCIGSSSVELALVTNKDSLDDKSSNQGLYEGIVRFGEEQNKRYKYFSPQGNEESSFIAAINSAIAKNPKVVIVNGPLFESAIHDIAQDNPKIEFVLVDACAHSYEDDVSETPSNLVNLLFNEHEQGFIAGYSAVKEGCRSLGFVGSYGLNNIESYGFGFVQGAEYAAMESGLSVGSVNIEYYYSSTKDTEAKISERVAGWYKNGTEAVFVCGREHDKVVIAAAEESNRKVITLDKDYSSESTAVLTCACKMYSDVVYNMMKEIYDGTWNGGQTVYRGAYQNAISLTTSTSHFMIFTKSQLNTILNSIASGRITIYSKASDTTGTGDPLLLRTTYAVVNYITNTK